MKKKILRRIEDLPNYIPGGERMPETVVTFLHKAPKGVKNNQKKRKV